MKKPLLVSLLVAVVLTGGAYLLTCLGTDSAVSHARREVDGVTRVFFDRPTARPEAGRDPLHVRRLQRGDRDDAESAASDPDEAVRTRRALR